MPAVRVLGKCIRGERRIGSLGEPVRSVTVQGGSLSIICSAAERMYATSLWVNLLPKVFLSIRRCKSNFPRPYLAASPALRRHGPRHLGWSDLRQRREQALAEPSSRLLSRVQVELSTAWARRLTIPSKLSES